MPSDDLFTKMAVSNDLYAKINYLRHNEIMVCANRNKKQIILDQEQKLGIVDYMHFTNNK